MLTANYSPTMVDNLSAHLRQSGRHVHRGRSACRKQCTPAGVLAAPPHVSWPLILPGAEVGSSSWASAQLLQPAAPS